MIFSSQGVQLHSSTKSWLIFINSYFLGFEAYRDSNGISFSQNKYVADLLKRSNMINAKPCSTPIFTGKKLFKEDGPLFDQPTFIEVL